MEIRLYHCLAAGMLLLVALAYYTTASVAQLCGESNARAGYSKVSRAFLTSVGRVVESNTANAADQAEHNGDTAPVVGTFLFNAALIKIAADDYAAADPPSAVSCPPSLPLPS